MKNELPVKVEVKVELSEEEKRMNAEEDRKEVEKRLKSFRHITENHYLCPKKINKQFRLVILFKPFFLYQKPLFCNFLIEKALNLL